MKLDIFNHFFPKAFYDRMIELSPKGKDINKRVREVPSIVDLDKRLRIVDQFDDYQQVICLPAPPLEDFGKHSVEMAKLGNDGMAELVEKHRDHSPDFP
jgi:aminocarboxymuconate-semialdehyde decarboxylase